MVKRKHKKMRIRQKILGKKTDSKNHDEGSSVSDPRRCPETVLCESPHADLLCYEKLSPEIISKRSKVRLRTKVCKAKVKDEVAARKIELSHPRSLKCHESDPKCDHEHDAKSTSDPPHLEDCPERNIGGSIVGETFPSEDCYSFRSLFLKKRRSSYANKDADNAPNQNISQLATFCSNLKSRLRDNVYIFMGDVPQHVNADEKSGGRSLEERSQHCKLEAMNDCHSLENTLSINDICQMENYLEYQPSTIVAGHFTVKKSASIADLHSESFDKFKFAKSSVRESVDGLRDTSRKCKPASSEKFGAKTLSKRLITNMHDLRKIFSHLWRMTKKISGQDKDRGASFLAKYKKFIDDRWHSYTSATLSSLSISAYPASPLSPSDANRSLSAKELRKESNQETEKTDFAIQSRFSTPRSGSPPSTKRCRLMFEDEEEKKVGESKRPATRAEITYPFLKNGRKNEESSFPLNLSFCEYTPHWNSRISESILSLSDVDPFAVPVYDSYKNFPQQERYEDDAYMTHRMSRGTATPQNSQGSVPRTIITWLIALCVWLKKKLLHILNSAYTKVQMINSFLTKKFPWTTNISEKERIDYLVTMLRFKNEKTLCELSEKMTRLSTDLVQTRMGIESSLDVLTTEMNVVREANRKMTENNATIMQELKRLHEILEEVQSKFSQSFPLSSCSYPSSSPPPPPPPPLPPALLPSSLPFFPKTQSSKLIAPKIPPPPPLPLSSVSAQPSKPLTQVTTPSNSGKSNRNRTPTRKFFTPSFNRPSITVEDLLKVTLRKAPQSVKDNARRQGLGVSQEMLRNVKLKSTKRRPTGDQIGRSPRSGRIIKSRTASNINLSPILTTGSENDLEHILRQVKLSTRPRKLLCGSSSFHDHDFAREAQSRESAPMYSQSQSESLIDSSSKIYHL